MPRISLTFAEMDAIDSVLSSDLACMEEDALAAILSAVLRKIRAANRGASRDTAEPARKA